VLRRKKEILPLLNTSGIMEHNRVLQQAGRQADEIQVISKFLKFTVQRNLGLFTVFNQGTASLEQCQVVFSGKAYYKVVFKV